MYKVVEYFYIITTVITRVSVRIHLTVHQHVSVRRARVRAEVESTVAGARSAEGLLDVLVSDSTDLLVIETVPFVVLKITAKNMERETDVRCT